MELIAYAEDLSVIIKDKTKHGLEDKAGYAVKQIIDKLGNMGLTVASEKTEALVLYGRNTIRTVELEIERDIIVSEQVARYLVVFLDRNLKITAHIREMVKKSHKLINSQMKIMPRMRGPKSDTRRLLTTVVTSVILYASPVWSSALQYKYLYRSTEKCWEALIDV